VGGRKLDRDPTCQSAPICNIWTASTQNVTSSWLNNGLVSLPIDASTSYTISCMPNPECAHDGLYEDIYFTTFVATDLNPVGSSTSYFTAIFNGAMHPPPPPNPYPPRPPPPSPSPPSPSPPPPRPSPPPPSCEPYWPPACDYVWIQLNQLISQNAELLRNISALQGRLA
jgi:hypothetical protein